MSWLPGSVPVRNIGKLQDEAWHVVVATEWTTWPVVHSGFPRAKSRWGFCQMRESMFLGPPYPNQADHAFSLPGLRAFTISAWLKKYLENECGQSSVEIIPNGVDTAAFYPDPMAINKERPVALIVGHQLNQAKNITDAAAAVHAVGGFDIWHVTPIPPTHMIKANKTFINPPQDKLRQIYSTADLLVMSSRAEGRSCYPVEAMACKLPVVAMNHRGTDDLQEDRALIARAGDVADLVRLIRFAIDEPEKTKGRAEAAYNYVLTELRWDIIGERLERLYGRKMV